MSTGTRRRLSRTDRRRQLLDVAGDLVARDGVAALTMDRLAAAAEVAAGLPYAYFRSVDDVLAALFEDVVGGIDEEIEELVAGGLPFADLVRRSLEVWVEALRSRRRLLLALLDGRANPAVAAALHVRDQRSRRTWQRALTEGFDLPDLDVEVLATMITDSAPGVLALAVGRRRAADDVIDRFVGLTVAAAEGRRR